MTGGNCPLPTLSQERAGCARRPRRTLGGARRAAAAGPRPGAPRVLRRAPKPNQNPRSRPGASRVIYLDFDGHVTSGTPWNNGRDANLTTPAFDVDGDPTTFNDDERRRVIAIWRAVAEDYSGFMVDVTTGGFRV